MSAFGTDPCYKIHATSLTMSAFGSIFFTPPRMLVIAHSPRHGEAHVDGDGVTVVERGRAAQLVAGRPGVPEGDRPTLVVLVQVRALQLQQSLMS